MRGVRNISKSSQASLSDSDSSQSSGSDSSSNSSNGSTHQKKESKKVIISVLIQRDFKITERSQ